MSSLIPSLNKPVHLSRWEWKGICYTVSLNSLNSFRVMCQKSHSDRAPKNIFNDLSDDNSIRSSFGCIGCKGLLTKDVESKGRQSYLLPSHKSHLLCQHLYNTSNCPFVSQVFSKVQCTQIRHQMVRCVPFCCKNTKMIIKGKGEGSA